MPTLEDIQNNAISAAISGNWKEAIALNLELLATEEDNISTLLRLGFAYMQTEKWTKAAECYKKVLKDQPNNKTAQDNIDKIEVLKKNTDKPSSGNDEKMLVNINSFLEIPGKTKTVVLVNLGQKQDLAQLARGEEVRMSVRKKKIEVRTMSDVFIGYIPDDISARLTFFLQENSVYKIFIKEATIGSVTVFIQEISKGSRVQNQTSFPAQTSMPHELQSQTEEEKADEDAEDGESDDIDENEIFVADEDWKTAQQNLENPDRVDFAQLSDEEDEREDTEE